MEKILISACLAGEKTRYDGTSCENELVHELTNYYDLVLFCPEVEGGLPTPRKPSERRYNSVKTEDGKDVTSNYNTGAQKALALCKYLGIRVAILKEKSPSCGVNTIYSGRFDHQLVKGSGVTTDLLRSKGIKVISEKDIPAFLEDCKDHKTKIDARIDKEKQLLLSGDSASSNKQDEEAKTFEKPRYEKKFSSKDGDFKKPYRKRESLRSDDANESTEGGQRDFKKPYRKKFDDGRKPYGDNDGGKSYGKSFGGNKPYHKDGFKKFDKSESSIEADYKSKKTFDNREGYAKRKRFNNRRSFDEGHQSERDGERHYNSKPRYNDDKKPYRKSFKKYDKKDED